jgi:hypothetical protein
MAVFVSFTSFIMIKPRINLLVRGWCVMLTGTE